MNKMKRDYTTGMFHKACDITPSSGSAGTTRVGGYRGELVPSPHQKNLRAVGQISLGSILSL